MNEELFSLDGGWINSPFLVTEVTQCLNCEKVGGISISLQPQPNKVVLLKIICKLCGMDHEYFAQDTEHAKILLQEVVDLYGEEE